MATSLVSSSLSSISKRGSRPVLYFGVKTLADYSQDSDEEALFKEVALGYLFLGIGKAVEKGFKMLKGSGASDEAVEVLEEGSSVGDEVVEVLDEGARAGDEVVESADEAVGTLDEAVEAGDEVAESIDDSVEVGDDVFDPNHPYKHLEDSKNVGAGKDFTAAQKKKIYETNRERNNGLLKDDDTGEVLVEAQKSKKGVAPPQNEAQVDHIIPKIPDDPNVLPGSNSYKNAKVISRKRNRAKSNKTDG